MIKSSYGMSSVVSLPTLKGHQDSVESAAFDPTGHILASASYDETIQLWETISGKLLRTLGGHQTLVTSVIFDPGWSNLGQW